MNFREILNQKWSVWLSFSQTGLQQKQLGYGDSLRLQHTFKSYGDLAYFWKASLLRNLKPLFVQRKPDSIHNVWKNYKINNRKRRINAVNFFKNEIKPIWEDDKNIVGGRLIFQVDKSFCSKSEENANQNDLYEEKVYQWLLFYFIGGQYERDQDINGIRFISAKFDSVSTFNYRVEIWVNFQTNADQKLKYLHNNFVKKFVEKFQVHNFSPTFLDCRKDTK